MEKEEYNKLKAEIIKEYGQPEWDMGDPYNEAARKLKELKDRYMKARVQAESNRKLASTVKRIVEEAPRMVRPIPEEVVRGEWLVAFNDKQKRIVHQFLQNTKQTPKQIADELNIPTEMVKNTMTLEAFHMLRRHLTVGCKELLPLESILALRDVLGSSNDATKLKAALVVLMDQGYIKASVNEASEPTEQVMDKDMMEKLREQAEALRKAKKE